MLLGSLDVAATYVPYLQGAIWTEALDWIRRRAATAAPGIYPLRGDAMFVNVHGYPTVEADKARFECHRRYVDLQYCIRGGETILWRPCVVPPGDETFDAAKDVRFRPVAGACSSLSLSPGLFAVFFPGDEHAPQIANGEDKDIWKLVVKIDHALV
jgi:YhcH/YjgK/YiaL family protein